MSRTAALFILLFSARPFAWGGAGSDALPFLKLDAGARGAALSGAYCAAGGDALSVFYNPAGTALAKKKEILLGHNEWLEGIRNETLAYVHPLGPRLTAFGGINALFSGSMDKYDSVGDKTGVFSSMEGAVSAGLSGSFGDGYYGGAAVKVLSQQAAGEKAMAWAGDAGLLKVRGGWRLGVSAANIGGRLKFGSRSFAPPLMLRAGISNNVFNNLTVSVEEVKAGASGAAAAAGAEWRLQAGPKEYFFLRAGYKTGRSRYAGPGYTAGIGLTNRDLSVDYAFAPYGELGAAHRVTAAFKFGAPRPEEFKRQPYIGLPKPLLKQQAAPEPEKIQEKKKADGKAKKKESGKTKKKTEKVPSEVYFMW